MPALSVSVPFPVFQNRDGQPLDNGYVYIGTVNLDAQTNPVQVYFDEALTIPAAQPLRTINGYVSNAGTPAQLYVNAVNFSIKLLDAKGTFVYSFNNGTQSAQGTYTDWIADTFTGNGVQTLFVLERAPGSVGNCDVSVNGLTLVPNTEFSLSGAILTFVTAPANGATILVRYGAAATQISATFSTELQTATAGQTVFSLNDLIYDPGTNALAVYVNGLRMVSGVDLLESNVDEVTFTSGLSLGDEVLFIAGRTINESIDANSVSYLPGGTGAVATTVQTKLRESVSVKDFGADPTGATNSTTALLNFFNYCIATGTPGHIAAGEYLVTAGVLAFDNGHVDTPWPNITTDGYLNVIFKRADATDAPMISITNGTAVSGAGNWWQGGSLGGILFNQNGQAKAANQHGLLLIGMVGTHFGHMRMDDGGGSCIYLQEKLYLGFNPDPYNIGSCVFDAAEANRCGGYAFHNNNGVGLTHCTIKYVRAIENVGGAFFGFGTSTTVNVISAGSCSGWALGNRNDSIGAAQRFILLSAELDDMQYGIDMRRVSNSVFGVGAVRFVHRYNFGPLNPAGGYWPRIVVQCSTNSVAMNNLRIIDRIQSGGTKPDLGQFFDFGSGGANTADIQIQRQIIDNAGFGFTVADYYTNFNANSTIQYTDAKSLPIIDTLKKTVALARAPTTFAVPTGGFTTSPNTVQYSTELTDMSGSYDPATWTYTCRSPGVYRIAGRIVLAVAIGTRIRMAIMVNGSAALTRFYYATTANAQCYFVEGELDLAAGATININADQNTAGAVNLTTMTAAIENQLSITQV